LESELVLRMEKGLKRGEAKVKMNEADAQHNHAF
jgi:hypothetical protein